MQVTSAETQFVDALLAEAARQASSDPAVRRGDFQTATVTAVAVTPGTVDVGAIRARCVDGLYVAPAVGDNIVLLQSGNGNWLALGRLAAGSDPIGGSRTAIRTADLPRTNNATATADPQIALSATAGAIYDLDAVAFYSGTPDLLLGWSVPSGTNGTWIGLGNGTTVVSGTGAGGTQQDISSTWGYTLRTESTAIGATRTYGGISTTSFAVQISGTIRVGATAGTIAMAWAQGTSSATATNLLTDSRMRLRRVS
ncbi:hypothetical protein [Streptomyces sp. NPDC010273]|uniref:hypothetical protein n=1 Tax=Streptomyces sp. NPDC010273 TaxID=3364829 RepID=UPI0036E01B3D